MRREKEAQERRAAEEEMGAAGVERLCMMYHGTTMKCHTLHNLFVLLNISQKSLNNS